MPNIVIQRPFRKGFIPSARQLRAFGMRVLTLYAPHAEVTIRIVSSDEMRELNRVYRHKDKPTNVLSFKMDIPEGVVLDPLPLGDVVICADVVNHEATTANQPALAHWAHMVIHGILHLLGHDHESDDETTIMQSVEITLMQECGFNNPYEIGNDN